jgi:hypothetical protein
MSRRLVTNLKRAYLDEQSGVYNPALLYDIGWDFLRLFEMLLSRLTKSRTKLESEVAAQFDTGADTDELLHRMFLNEQTSANLSEHLQNLKSALRSNPERLMLTIDFAVDAMHTDNPLIAYLADAETQPVIEWIVARRDKQTNQRISYCGVRALFSR